MFTILLTKHRIDKTEINVFRVWCRVPHTIDDLSIRFDGIPWWDGIVLRQVFFCFSWAILHKSNRVKCSHLSFLATEDEVKRLHSLIIIMDWVLGQSNPSNYFALTKRLLNYFVQYDICLKYFTDKISIPSKNQPVDLSGWFFLFTLT